MSNIEQSEAVERTLAEMESQHSAAQQVLSEALAELEVLYAELEEQAQLLENMPASGDAPVGESPEAADLHQRLEEMRQQRDACQVDLEAALQEVEALGNLADLSSGLPLAIPSEPQGVEQTAPQSPLRAPFQRLREARAID